MKFEKRANFRQIFLSHLIRENFDIKNQWEKRVTQAFENSDSLMRSKPFKTRPERVRNIPPLPIYRALNFCLSVVTINVRKLLCFGDWDRMQRHISKLLFFRKNCPTAFILRKFIGIFNVQMFLTLKSITIFFFSFSCPNVTTASFGFIS